MLYPTKVLLMPFKPKLYTEVVTIKVSKQQKSTLDKLKSYNIPTARFIREAIKEKIKREYNEIKQTKSKTPF